ncbi:MAG: toll/interleukin-1 receptor domain-containing protein [Verrucomicrobia bacterium]|nr:toll/interleukin-1 receptor domain-containing protein [Verrucomicrobiota bacterium]
MSGQIFISYRREESRWSARSLYDRLCTRFDRKQIFMDIDAIPLGDDFVKAIEETVSRCDVLVAIIGAHWLTSTDEKGGRRLDDPEDFVRREIGTALRRNIRVIPVLVDGALIPRSTDLPEDLKPLVRRNALQVTETGFDDDCRRLVVAIEQVLEKSITEGRERQEIQPTKTNRYETKSKKDLTSDSLQKEHAYYQPLTKQSQSPASQEHLGKKIVRHKILFALSTLALVLLGLSLWQMGAILSKTRIVPRSASESVVKLAAVDPSLLGTWESLGHFQTFTLNLEFTFNRAGTFSRRYFFDESGSINAEHGKYSITGSKSAPSMGGTYTFQGNDTMTWVWGDPVPVSAPIILTRAGKCEYPEDLFVGIWRTTLLIQGANWDWTLEIGRERNYHSHFEANDDGMFTAAEGKWQMISGWSTTPINGTYQIPTQGDPRLNIWPFNWITLKHASKAASE